MRTSDFERLKVFAAVAERVHAPPLSAVPQPFATVLTNASAASAVPVPEVTITDLDAVPVADWLSVTVSVTV